jgi:hypothetical protein
VSATSLEMSPIVALLVVLVVVGLLPNMPDMLNRPTEGEEMTKIWGPLWSRERETRRKR